MFGGIKMTEIKEQLSQLNKMSNKSEALYHKVAFSKSCFFYWYL